MLSYYKSSLISLFIKVKELNKNPSNSALCLEIQEILIKKITYIEQRIRKLKSTLGLDKKSLKTRRVIPFTKEQTVALKKEIEISRDKINEYSYLIYIYKCVGDAIVFTYLNKWDIKPMAIKESPGFISGKKGSRLERKSLREVIKKTNSPIILNDLTNCLRYGDITLPKGEKFMILEMKSKKKRI